MVLLKKLLKENMIYNIFLRIKVKLILKPTTDGASPYFWLMFFSIIYIARKDWNRVIQEYKDLCEIDDELNLAWKEEKAIEIDIYKEFCRLDRILYNWEVENNAVRRFTAASQTPLEASFDVMFLSNLNDYPFLFTLFILIIFLIVWLFFFIFEKINSKTIISSQKIQGSWSFRIYSFILSTLYAIRDDWNEVVAKHKEIQLKYGDQINVKDASKKESLIFEKITYGWEVENSDIKTFDVPPQTPLKTFNDSRFFLFVFFFQNKDFVNKNIK